MAILSGAAEKQLVFFSFWIGLFYLLLIIFVCTSKRKGSRLLRVKNGGCWSGQSRLPSGPSKSFEKNEAAGEFPVFSFVYFCDVCRFGLFCFDFLRLFVWVHNSHNCASRGRPLLPVVRIVRASMISRAPADANFVNFICFFVFKLLVMNIKDQCGFHCVSVIFANFICISSFFRIQIS